MFDRFLAFTKENRLIQKGDSILVGVSGGVDSVVLLDMLLKLQKKLDICLAVAHVNYSLRYESDKDEKFVKDLAQKHKLPFFIKKVKLAGNNIEEKARDIRYDFFNDISKHENFNKVAVAHHKNDLVETFILNLSRGSGLCGLVSMKVENHIDSRLRGNDKECGNDKEGGNDNKLIRPLLFSSRKEVENYAEKNKLKFVEDKTNKDLKFKRNLVRHKVITELEKTQPDFVETVADEIKDLSKVYEIVMAKRDSCYKKIAKDTAGSVSFSVKLLESINPYLQTEILRKAIENVQGSLRDISRKNIQDVLKLMQSTNGTKTVTLRQGLIVRRTYDKLEIIKEAKSLLEKPKSIKLKMGEEAFFGNWRLFLSENNKKATYKDKNLVFLDIQKMPMLHVRCRKPGDRIGIGNGQTKSLQDIFVDAKIPRDERDTYPVVVTTADEVVWLPSLRISAKFRTEGKDTNLVSLKAIQK